ncbi:MAG TPA: ABC transporter permease [Thermoanaerobaculia bacterium]|nr:ABC transporter permease [Thermoanaerobaculia bacterium]
MTDPRQAHGSSGDRWLGFCRRLVAWAALLAPGARRSEHRREWDAELVGWWRSATGGRRPGMGVRLRALRRALLAATDALDLQLHRQRHLHAVRRAAGAELPRSRHSSSGNTMGTLVSDLRYAVRSLRSRPQWTAVALLTLALGIGASTVISSVVRSVVWKPLPYPQPERLVDVWPEKWWTKEMIDWLRAEASSYQAVAGWSEGAVRWNREETTEIVQGPEATAELLEVLGRPPLLGRDLERGDETPERDHLLVTYGFWQEQLGGAPDVIGSTLRIEDRPAEIVGILPPGLPLLQRDARLVRPLNMHEDDAQRRSTYLHVVGRLRPGVTVEAAGIEMRALAERWRERGDHTDDWGRDAAVKPLRDSLIEDVRPTMTLLLAAIGCTLLVAAANVANLLLARSVERRREVQVRAALGARPGRLVRQALTESTLLALTGGALGIGAAVYGLRLVVRLLPRDMPRAQEISLDGSMLGLALLLTVGVGWVVGLAPAWHAARVDLRPGPRGDRGGPSGSRLRAALVIAEVSLAALLLVGAGLLTKSFLRAMAVELGVETEGVLTFAVIPETGRFENAQEVSAFYERLESEIAGLAGVRSVASALAVPVQNTGWTMGIWAEGAPPPEGEDPQWVNWRPVTPGYFDTTGSSLVAGRVFDPRDRAGAQRVAILSERTARLLFGDQPAVGERVIFPWEGREPITVVGVARDVRIAGPRSDPPPVIYRPYHQSQEKLQSILIAWRSLVVAVSGEPRALLPAIEERIAMIDRGAAVHRVETMEEILAENLSAPRVTALLVGCFGLAAFVLGAIGVYGVMERMVSDRQREIAIRLALGGTRRDVLSSVLGRGLRLTMTGVTLGLLGAVAASRLLESLLFAVSPRDPWIFGAVAGGLATIALLATWWPARRAARTDPARSLAIE